MARVSAQKKDPGIPKRGPGRPRKIKNNRSRHTPLPPPSLAPSSARRKPVKGVVHAITCARYIHSGVAGSDGVCDADFGVQCFRCASQNNNCAPASVSANATSGTGVGVMTQRRKAIRAALAAGDDGDGLSSDDSDEEIPAVAPPRACAPAPGRPALSVEGRRRRLKELLEEIVDLLVVWSGETLQPGSESLV
ncbi:hypothetical protein IFR05_014622 [Cadophora sp. M221]|nr:hypothetical protein IFR05_014622 [Cadophora sp. M221]